MRKLVVKLKKTNFVLRFIYFMVGVFYTVASCAIVFKVLELENIKTLFKGIVLGVYGVFLLYYIFINFRNLIHRRNKTMLLSCLVAILLVLLFIPIKWGFKVFNNLMEKSNTIHTIYLISLKESDIEEDGKLGIISSEAKNQDNYLANELYNEKNYSNELVTYDDYFELISDLYNKKLVGVFVPSNYVSLFGGDFENIDEETKIVAKKSQTVKNEDKKIVSNKKFSEPLTFLLLGVDSKDNGLDAEAAFNGDTLMLVSLNPKTLEMVMFSIPRDTFVPIACRNNQYAKINSSAAYGTSCVIDTINNFLDLKIDYYVKINFKGVVELVNAVGGVEVDVEKPAYSSFRGDDFKGRMCEQNSDREFGDKLICVDPGLQTLNGEEALAYARNRHLYRGGDLDRIKHQQQVVEALLGKVVKLRSISELQRVIDAISNNIATNMDMDTILSGYEIAKNVMSNGTNSISINKAHLEEYDLNVYLPRAKIITMALGYYQDSLEAIQKALKETLGLVETEYVKTFDFSINEEYSVPIIGKGLKSVKSCSVLPSFVGKTYDDALSFCSKNNISCNEEYVDSSLKKGTIAEQSPHQNVLLSTVDSLTVYISKGNLKEDSTNNEVVNSLDN